MLKKLLTGENASLTRYVEESKRFPILAPDEERELAVAWRDRGNGHALERLVGSHLRLVIKIARGFGGYGLPLVDLVAEGNVGLMQAAQKFDPGRGFRFATYATWWIRAAIQEYILHSWSLVKMGTTAAQKKLFFNLRRLKSQMQELEQGDLSPSTVTAIATELDVPEQEVIEMNRRLSSNDSSLDAALSSDGETNWLELLADDRPTQESVIAEADELALRRRLVGQALERLDDRERRILFERRLKEDPSTLESLSQQFCVSRERVRQIEVRAFEKLQKAVLSAAQALRRAPAHMAA
ncbi:RNA polymerase factor sigma-32 [Azospirillum baldaniorum]|uniref:RNA polymerase sigma factor RpoH n=1 Tax=Azospirillum baldaniorum TaxID=1064539 RepID=A0A9P1JRB3_9PROT|nr:RNA polymerase sigma factor RpoH [Azospirillum baldaniorum]TWA75559.1 RNA polymerase RpoH-like sigma 32 subunit [Azospirillum brasilense]AWJ89765.1 RNA polymerase factor sigma-32 [Azospirillum baldaniorum]NUB07773.1 RNA polymerase sigma factor RpoH [Azospirillum baldaniorum]TWA59532.1 RNA polymerase RpoH-like sigma 32 subunit [Azospirillum baldaniorum]CCC98251.1 RNA polymerase sigma factor (sigma32) [Azospirillum baldaniorum]